MRQADLNDLYFSIGTIELLKFHRFLQALSPRRLGFVKRMNLDLATVESVGGVLRLLERFSAIEVVTLGFPRGHDCLEEALLMDKLKADAPAIKLMVMAMQVLQQINVAVVGNEYRRNDPLVITEARRMQMVLQSLVDKKRLQAGRSDAVSRPSGNVAVFSDADHPQPVGLIGTRGPLRVSTSNAGDCPAQRFSNFHERYETPPPPEHWPELH